MSIVMKLGINASKSHIRLFNLPTLSHTPEFHYTTWVHKSLTVATSPIPIDTLYSDNTTSTTTPYHIFGIYNDLHGSTDLPQNNILKHLPYCHNCLLHKTLTNSNIPALYQSLAMSLCTFNPLASSCDLHNKTIKNDLSIFPKLNRLYNLHPSDPSHPLFLPASLVGNQFRSLTSTMLQGYSRELLVSSNIPHSTSPTPTQISI